MSHDLTVWGIGTSRTMRVHWMLLELGLEYECHPIQSRTGETRTDEFKRLNPRHKIPVLRHKGRINIGFVDGHAETLGKDQWSQVRVSPYRF